LINVCKSEDLLKAKIKNSTLTHDLTEGILRSGELGLVEVVRSSGVAQEEKFLLIIDQFEEIFRFANIYQQGIDVNTESAISQSKSMAFLEAKDEASTFVKLFLAATNKEFLTSIYNEEDIRIYVILTMRAEFWGNATQFRDLPEALSNSQFLVPRLTRSQLREAIEGPIKVAQGKVSNQLVNELLNDIGDDPDQLPILQHALMRTWDYWAHENEREAIDIQHYNSIGGMEGGLSRHLDELFESKPQKEKPNSSDLEEQERSQLIVKVVFNTLTEVNNDQQLIRRPSPLSKIFENVEIERKNRIELQKFQAKEDQWRDASGRTSSGDVSAYLKQKFTLEDITKQVERFRGPGRSFIMPPDGPLSPETVIDISHESIIRKWRRLRNWKNEETILNLKQEIRSVSYSGSNVASQKLLEYAWERHDIYSDNASKAQQRFFFVRRLLANLAIIIVLLSVIQPIVRENLYGNIENIVSYSFLLLFQKAPILGLVNLFLIVLPIVSTALLAFAVKFDRGNNWILLRGNSEVLKMEIFYYRAQVGQYRHKRNAVLAEKLKLISQRVKGSAVHQAALNPYEGQPPTRLRKGIIIVIGQWIMQTVRRLSALVWDTLFQTKETTLPSQSSIESPDFPKGDSPEENRYYLKRYADLNADEYLSYRLEDQFDWYRRKAKAYDRDYQILQVSVYFFGGMGTLLAAIGFQNWIAVSTAFATTLAGYLEFKRVEATLAGYNQAADALYDIRAWWYSLSDEEQSKPVNFEKLVVSTEETIRSEHSSWLQDMQDRLANLYGDVGEEDSEYEEEDPAYIGEEPERIAERAVSSE
jgi:hypothetical protein